MAMKSKVVQIPAPTDLKGADVNELEALYWAHTAAADTFLAFVNQPRYRGLARLDAWRDFHAKHKDKIVEMLRNATPNDHFEVERIAEVIAHHGFACGDGIQTICADLANLAVTEENLKRKEQRVTRGA